MAARIRTYLLTAALAAIVPGQSIAADSLIGKVTAERMNSGLAVAGSMQNVPPGTKLRVEVVRISGRSLKLIDRPSGDAIVGNDGIFRTNLSSNRDSALDAGTYTIQITAMFNRGWQSIEVLRKAGVDLDSQGRSDLYPNPKNLPYTSDFKPFDPEFPRAGRYIEVRREVALPPLGADKAAIEAVKKARLTVQGHGRSSLSIGKSVALYAAAPGFTPNGWTAAKGPGGKWTVTLDCVDGGKKTAAQWEYDPQTQQVKYLDPLAKTLSYVPSE